MKTPICFTLQEFMDLPKPVVLERFAAMIFDCDGTLTNSMPLHYIAWKQTMGSVGIEFPEDRFYSMGGMPSEKIIAILSDEQSKPANADQLSVEKEECFFELLPQLQRIDVVCEIAKSFAKTLPIAVASGGILDAVQKQLRAIDLSELFEVLVTAEDTELHKPEPDVFLEAAKRLKVAPEQCIVFEDSPLGIEAAKRAKMQCVDVRDWPIILQSN